MIQYSLFDEAWGIKKNIISPKENILIIDNQKKETFKNYQNLNDNIIYTEQGEHRQIPDNNIKIIEKFTPIEDCSKCSEIIENFKTEFYKDFYKMQEESKKRKLNILGYKIIIDIDTLRLIFIVLIIIITITIISYDKNMPNNMYMMPPRQYY